MQKISPRDTLETLYSSIVEPHFHYCCSAWGYAGLAGIDQLQKPQNRAARIVTHSSYDAPSGPLIQSLGWKTIQRPIQNESQIMVFKSLNGLKPQSLGDLFTKNLQCSSYSLCNTATGLMLTKKNTSTGQKAFSYRGAWRWNSLSAEAKLASSLSCFKKVI